MPHTYNAVIAQSGGPTTVINASAAGAIQAALRAREIGTIFGATNGVLGILQEELFDLGRETPETIEAMKRTPAAAIGSCRYKLKNLAESRIDYERILDVFKAHDIRAFFYAGGNDSMDTADKINKLAADSKYELSCMGIPKSIDNDLAYTDHCPGYGSVAKYVATAAMNAGRDTEALYTSDTCSILEVMGRNAGWIAAATGLARREPQDAPHLIYMPEAAFSFEKLVTDVKAVHAEFGRVFIVAGEGLKDDKGQYVTAETSGIGIDSFGHAQLGGRARRNRRRFQRWQTLQMNHESGQARASVGRSFALRIVVDVRSGQVIGQVADRRSSRPCFVDDPQRVRHRNRAAVVQYCFSEHQ